MTKTEKQYDKQTRLFIELIDKKINARMGKIDRTVKRLIEIVRSFKNTPPAVEALKKELDDLKGVIADFNVKELENEVFTKVNDITSSTETALGKQEKLAAHVQSEVEAMRNDLAGLHKTVVNAAAMKSVAHDIEALKTKSQWLELEVEKLNISPLLDRINEIEARIDALKISQPYIIE